MNTIRSTMQRSATLAARRFATVAMKMPKQTLVPEVYNYSFTKAFFSDPSTYPLIVVMTVATAFLTGMSLNAMIYYKNVKVLPSRKHDIIPTWGYEHVDSVTKIMTKRPVGFHSQSFKDIRQEGLGVNHEEWMKSKAAAAAK